MRLLWLLLPAAALAAENGNGQTKQGAAQHGSGQGRQGVAQPTLLGLRPDAGPLDGGTRVSVQAVGLSREANYSIVLMGVLPQVHIAKTTAERTAEGLAFRMPDLSKVTSAGKGVLVTLWESRRKGKPRRRWRHNGAGTLFFRVLEPLKMLAPVRISPCCHFKLSGGQTAVLTGAMAVAPAAEPVVKIMGRDHEETVSGQLVLPEWGLSAAGQDLPKDAWHVFVVMPPWPHPEEDVTVGISWNRQQFALCPQRLHIFLQKSLFGEAAKHINEDHLVKYEKFEEQLEAKGDDSASPSTEEEKKMTVVSHRPASSSWATHGIDLSEAMLVDHQGDAFILARSKDLSHLAEDLRIVQDLFMVTCTSTIMGGAALALSAPNIIGYLLGGVLLGPGCLDWIVELVQVESVAELGVCLLLFSIGLELTWQELRSNVRASLAGLLAMALLCLLVVLFATFCTKTPLHEALCVGLFSALASTAVSLKAVPSSKEGGKGGVCLAAQEEASALLAILVTQDIVLAGMLAALPLVFRGSAEQEEKASGDATLGPVTSTTARPTRPWWPVELDLSFKVAGVMFVVFLGGAAFHFRQKCGAKPQDVLNHLARIRQRVREAMLEMDGDYFTLLVLSYSFALAYVTNRMGLSIELGAFLAGLSLTSFSHEIGRRSQHLVDGLKDTFLAWFFASIGFIISPGFLIDNYWPILVVVVLIFLLKLFTGFLPLWLLARRGSPRPAWQALRTAWILSHISEFGFILASKGIGWRVLSRHVYLLLVGANAVSLFFAPWLFRLREWLLPALKEDAPREVGEEAELSEPGTSRGAEAQCLGKSAEGHLSP